MRVVEPQSREGRDAPTAENGAPDAEKARKHPLHLTTQGDPPCPNGRPPRFAVAGFGGVDTEKLTEAMVQELRTDAMDAGDDAQRTMCEDALYADAGSWRDNARKGCASAITDARAARADSKPFVWVVA